ncbi:MAG TPA: PP2C family serine/threonine-protein phosphatase [Pyrinomonadaceae bacterium]|nr:PP2C family serine/threonine-protein phosphatase [Pyrinomonadaceae bacterium]
MSIEWRVVGRTVRGATHERNGLPNQDAIHWLPASGRGSSVVLAVADGHGSARYSRSHIGAALAVEKGTQLIDEFLNSHADLDNLSLIKHATEEWLPRTLVRHWTEAVNEHLQTDPLTEDESSRAESWVAYGATVLLAAVTERFVIYLQLGDGDILTVNDRGEVSRPMAKDERLFGNETTSLCAADAWRDFRVNFQPLHTRATSPPALILLSTDGYPNSFRDEAGFFKVGSDLLQMINENGLARVEQDLEGWLRDSTRAGSGDDVTLGILCSLDK